MLLAVACLHFDKVIVINRRLKYQIDANLCNDMQSRHLVALYVRLGKLNICRSTGLHLNCIGLDGTGPSALHLLFKVNNYYKL